MRHVCVRTTTSAALNNRVTVLNLLEFRGVLAVRDALGNLGFQAPLEMAIRHKSTLLRHRVPEAGWRSQCWGSGAERLGTRQPLIYSRWHRRQLDFRDQRTPATSSVQERRL